MSGIWVELAQDDSIESVAFRYGHFPQTLWDAPDNKPLRDKRASMHVLRKGDRVFVPPREPASHDCATGQRHRFERRAVPSRLTLQLMLGGQVIAARPCHVELPGRPALELTSDADGMVSLPLMPDAGAGQLRVTLENGSELVFPLTPRALEPVDTLSGLHARLRNLGYLGETLPEPAALSLALALGNFQTRQGLTRTGLADDETREALLRAHGC